MQWQHGWAWAAFMSVVLRFNLCADSVFAARLGTGTNCMGSSVVVLQAANVDATLSRRKRQHALAEEKKRLAANAAAAAERAIRDGQPLDPDFNPSRIGSGQFGNTEAENRAAAAAQLANQMSQVLDCDPPFAYT